ncbi:MAG: biopolymer transporter ExbD [Rhodobacteraceae bacterium]|nr:biopolymer transporter ExbD [Paracoccaceae bacterium]
MKLKRRKRTVPQETIVSLIDVIFFLLVFFMMVGRMDATAPFDVAPPISLAGTDMPQGGTTISVAEDGRLALDGVELAEADLLDGIRSQLVNDPDLFVRINAHGRARLQKLLPLVSKLERVGVPDVVLVVTPNPE